MTTAPEQSPVPPDDGGWVGTFIRRPVLTIVLNLLIIIAGYTALQGIEIRELPDVDRPIVTVRAAYEGATPQTMDAQITAIIESAVSRVQGVSTISSNSSYGSSRVTIEFSSSTKRDAVAAIRGQLPADMRDDPSVVKADADATPIMRLVISAEKLSEAELTDLVNNVIKDRLAAVEGVASATSFGLRARTIEVRVNQVALARRGLALSDLMSAIGKASITGPSGALDNPTQQLLVKAEAPIQTPEEVGALELNATTRVSDVAFVRWGYREATAITRHDGRTAVGMEIIRQAQSNTIGISEGVRAAIDELKRSLPRAWTYLHHLRRRRVHRGGRARGRARPDHRGRDCRHRDPSLPRLHPRDHRTDDRHPNLPHRHAGGHLDGRLLAQHHHAAGARRGDGPRRRRRHHRH